MEHQSESDFLAHENHALGDHLHAVALLAGQFAAHFSSADWAELAGLWHDLGKYQPDFQRKLRGEKFSVEHSGAGAAYAMSLNPSMAYPLAFVIAGHHAGLANWKRSEADAPKPLDTRLGENRALLKEVVRGIPPEILNRDIPPFPAFLQNGSQSVEDKCRRIEFWTRFLFSALTDADYLDTEAALDPERSALRPAPQPLKEFTGLIEAEIHRRTAGASPGPVNEARRLVAEACRNAAQRAPGFFSLTAPTGAGKTLAAMRFALHHAQAHGMRRVIVVLPYTSIIEQNAAVYREVFGDAAVLEHHSNLDPETERQRSGEELTEQHRLASENWEAPLVVTTSVQFLESLFANRSTRCRKLHNIARSVVIFDEVQSLPPGLLIPILDALKTLVSGYGCTILLSTATPPALVARTGAEWGLPAVTEIIPDTTSLFRALRRVRFEWPANDAATTWEELAGRLRAHRQALAVVHLRDDARRLAGMLAAGDDATRVFHLSAAMCPAHRSQVLGEVRAALAAGESCHLVSTQLIEAGVDIDFPVVYRAMAGLDSIVQAAGRCNREGRLPEGAVHVFHAPTQPPPGVLRQGIQVMQVLCRGKGAALDASDPETCIAYFRLFYSATAGDVHGIQAERAGLNFATVAAKFRLIEDQATAAIIVPYQDKPARHVEAIRRGGPTRDHFRALQPYTVRIYPQALRTLQNQGAVEELAPGMFVLLPHYGTLYHPQFGLMTNDESLALLLA